MNPLVSICVPMYNSEHYIFETIKSVIDQQYKNFELLVVDNCSTDHTVSIVKKFRDQRIKIYKNKKNLGLVGNFNRCLQLAQGKYVTILCSDDIIEPDFLSKAVSTFERDPHIGLLYTAVMNIDGRGNQFSQNFPFVSSHLWAGERETFALLTKNYINVSGSMMRRECLRKVGLFSTSHSYSLDWNMWLRICGIGYKIAYIPETLARRRYHQRSMTTYFTANEVAAHDSYNVAKEFISKTQLRNLRVYKALAVISAMSLYNALFGILFLNRKRYEHHMKLWLHITKKIEQDFRKDVRLLSATYGLLVYAKNAIFHRYINPFVAKHLYQR